MRGEKSRKPRGHVGVPRRHQKQKSEDAAQAQDRPQPQAPARHEKRRQQHRAQWPERAVQPLAHRPQRQEYPEKHVPPVTRKTSGPRLRRGESLLRFRRHARFRQTPDGQGNEAGQEWLRLYEVIEDPHPQHRGQHHRRREAEPLAAESPHDQVSRDDPARRGQRIGQPERELIFAQERRRYQHRPIDQWRLLHAR